MELCHETAIVATFFEFADQYEFSLFPIEAGTKAPLSGFKWKECSSEDPSDWRGWKDEGHNVGINAERSGIIIIDIDASRVGRDTAWQAWCNLCKSWGTSAVLAPMCQSARGGWHVAIGRPAGIDCSSLRGTAVLTRDAAGKELIGVKVRGYTVAPGSFYNGDARGETSGPYLLMPDAPPPHPCPPALLAALERPPILDLKPMDNTGEIDLTDLCSLVEYLAARGEFEDYDEWVRCGMICKLAAGNDGLEAWRLAHDESVTPEVESEKWTSFANTHTPGDRTIGSLIKRGRELDWRGNIRKSADAMFAGMAALAAASLEHVVSPSIAPHSGSPVDPPPDLIQNSAEFLADFTPPNYLIDGVVQQRFCYAITAQGGVGKTAIAMALTIHVALGKPLGGIAVEKGHVLYLAGENPTDIKMRWFGLTQEHGVSPDNLKASVHFMPHAVDLFENAGRISQEILAKGLRPSLVIVDTAAAYNFGDEENNNSQQKLYAQQLRSLVNLPGEPCVLILCHPTKGASDDALTPRGGSAFLNEIDGNIAVRKQDSMLTIGALAKFRGPEFPPISFALKSVTHPRLIDSKGRAMPTVVANVIGEHEGAIIAATARRHEDLVLKTVDTHPTLSLRERAIHLTWRLKTAPFGPDVSKMNRALGKLDREKLIQKNRSGEWSLTEKGQQELNRLDMKRPPTTLVPMFPSVSTSGTVGPPMPPVGPAF